MPRGEGSPVYLPTYTDHHGRRVKSGVWCFRIQVGGKRQTISTGCRDKKDAQRWRIEKLAALGRGDANALRADRVMFEDLAKAVEAEYIANDRRSIRHLRLHLGHLRKHLGHFRAMDITTDRLTAFAMELRTQGYAAATINLHYAALQRAFTLLVQARRLGRDQAPHFPYLVVRNARQGFVERADLEGVLARMAPELARIVRVLYFTGWRRQEVLSREWRHVDFAGGWLRLEPEETKNRDGRSFPLFRQFRAELEDQRAYTNGWEQERHSIVPWVWHRRGKRVVSIQDAWKKARTEAGLPGLTLHDLRRSAARNLERAGVVRSVAMKYLGHRTEAMYRRYAIASEGDLRQEAEKLDRFHSDPPGLGVLRKMSRPKEKP